MARGLLCKIKQSIQEEEEEEEEERTDDEEEEALWEPGGPHKEGDWFRGFEYQRPRNHPARRYLHLVNIRERTHTSL